MDDETNQEGARSEQLQRPPLASATIQNAANDTPTSQSQVSASPGPGWWQASDGGWHPADARRLEPPGATIDSMKSGMKRRKWPLVVGGLILLLVIAVVVVEATRNRTAPTSANGGATSSHTITLKLGVFDYIGNPCIGTGGASDIGPGTSVTVQNGSGSIIGTASLGGSSVSGGVCYFTVAVPVPQTNFYVVKIGSGHGSQTYSLAQLEGDGWRPPALGIGG